jgi:hypothetical protein
MESVQSRASTWQRLQAALDLHRDVDLTKLDQVQRDEIARLEKEAEAALRALHDALVAYRTRKR